MGGWMGHLTFPRTIPRQADREALIDVYSKGPLSINEMYNDLVEANMGVFIPEAILQSKE